ncbi:MAG: MoaD/ThiS family protein [Fretibacterium sp.]|uniref:MoaD/ThiS family protein n=1 Tax=Fretibacterium sp. OH1220_COT-178 TaxID=2491047 RepID=UPI000F600E71|nr:MoaD/ThiS family protein [Fretibacterium sp. OH1220_COT-178]MDO4786581.1 MoaD/ThiS family protein [Fretibacterium sp.]RRD64738.1 hypothetical protein EII26_05825 [Fretibacterium sp. OH1220_COT-178]
MVKVLLFGELKRLAASSEVFLEVRETNVLNALVDLSARYGGRFREIVLGDGDERAIVLVNGAPVRFGVMEKRLNDGDVLSLMPLCEEGPE